ncbi:MAG: Z1 domain-containing protein [Proteobacteria bacterium]|nr:Z1 domain-containing protein [Pseudomonadota bacterium]
MSDFNAELAYYRTRISRDHADALASSGALPADAIDEALRFNPFDLPEEALAQIGRMLRASYAVQQTVGDAITSGFTAWVRQRKDIDFWYWERLKRFNLETGKLPEHVVGVLDRDTTEVLDFCGNPADAGPWARRGMVLGHVQSGKTTNYSSLICKAADAGYKVIILLAGITNSLRAQTQERIDEAFIGRKSFFGARTVERLPIVNFAEGFREPAFGTTRDRDFHREQISYGVGFATLNEPVVFVLKKNKSTLENLRDWISNQARGGRIDYPLLLIDDEADNASVNTSKEVSGTTAINKAIREILALFNRSSYVGYTATPFANIFIDPETEDEMLRDDLFPRHFIKALDAPSNYVGAQAVFSPSGRLRDRMVRVVDDYEDILPLSHKRGDPIVELPLSLIDAVRAFVLARAIRVRNGDGSKHASMMINVSRFNDIQERVFGLVYSQLEKIRKAIVVNAGAGAAGWRDGELKALARVFDAEFASDDLRLDDLTAHLHEAVRTIEVRTVNMKGGELDYSRHASEGLHVIAIGGLALSRGLTLEGLIISYILRNTAASDTLMQMARWFGYRPGYEDLCRLYLPQSSLEHYEFIEEATEELRDEIKRMKVADQTPEQFGLKVRESPTTLRITAANKMRTARALTLAQDYSERHIEGHVLFNAAEVNEDNMAKVGQFLAALGPRTGADAVSDADVVKDLCAHRAWMRVSGQNVLELIEKFRFPPSHPDLGPITANRSLFADYVSDRITADLKEWDVVLPLNSVKSAEQVSVFPGLGTLAIRSRAKGEIDERGYHVTSRNRIADPADARLLLPSTSALPDDAKPSDRNYCRLRERPLLLVHLFWGALASGAPAAIGNPIVSLSFCLPSTGVRPKERAYQVNKVYQRQLELFASEDEDDRDGAND